MRLRQNPFSKARTLTHSLSPFQVLIQINFLISFRLARSQRQLHFFALFFPQRVIPFTKLCRWEALARGAEPRPSVAGVDSRSVWLEAMKHKTAFSFCVVKIMRPRHKHVPNNFDWKELKLAFYSLRYLFCPSHSL